MKRYLVLSILCAVCCLALGQQTNNPAPETAPPATAPAAQPETAPPTAPPTTTPAAQPETAPPTAPPTTAPDTAATNVTAQPTPENAATNLTAQPAPDTNAPPAEGAQPGAVISIISMDDLPLTSAIKNLARQAGLNYILDPKISFGQPGPGGTILPEPLVSVRWENVTAAQALSTLLGNYDLQIVEDPKSKIARIVKKDPAAPDPLATHVIQLRYASPSNLVVAVQNTLIDKRSKVVADVRSSQLVVLATDKELVDVNMLVERLDTPTKQVLIEARLLETAMNPQTAKGIDWRGTLQAQHIAYGNGFSTANTQTKIPGDPITARLPSGRGTGTIAPSSSAQTTIDTFSGNGGFSLNTASGLTPNIGFLNADGVAAVLSFINQDSDTKVLSNPRTVTLDNETAHISVTRATPIINVTPGTVQVSGGSQITYTNLGVILDVTPRISANNFVNLKVVPEVSRVFDTVTRVVGSGTSGQNVFQVDEYDIRKLETRVMIPSGNTLVLGGLMQDDQRNGTTKVPVLGDVPVLGLAFRSENKQRTKSNLTIFITPTIVQDEDFQPTVTEFLRTPLPTVKEENWSSWDSTKPWDWSKPAFKKDTEESMNK